MVQYMPKEVSSLEICPIGFRGVYRTNNSEFSPVQYKVSKMIREVLTSPSFVDKNGRTPSDKLKDKGYDTLISPSGTEKVDVYVVTDLQRGVDKEPDSFTESFFVGTYDNRSLFSSNDIYKAINDNKRQWSYYATMLSVPVFALLGLAVKCCTNNLQTKPHKIENSIVKTSLQDTVKTMPADAFKLVQKIK